MLFNTMQYILFLIIVVVIYWCLPWKIRYIWLLMASYYFYMQWNTLYILLIFGCTLLTYLFGRTIERLRHNESKFVGGGLASKSEVKICLVVCILLNLSILGFFKYFDFAIQLMNRLLRCVHINEINWNHDILLPVGISFYTLQALGYLIDVYRGEICAEKNFMKYALFVSFFPQLVAGPIERSKNLLVQLQKAQTFQYENLRKGLMLILYGMFLKMVIADRAAMIVNTVYAAPESYPGVYIGAATIFFAIQIYCDFYGYSTIARGSALLMGIHLMDNFNAPYYARSVKEFWRRWHISLSGWFRDYLYIPLGGSRKGSVRKKGNILTVFMVSGLWHGASTAFIFWGFLNGVYQVAEDIFAKISGMIENVEKKWKYWFEAGENNQNFSFSKKLFQTIRTFLLVTFAWLFFRAGGMQEAMCLLKNMFTVYNWVALFDGSLYELGVAQNYMMVLLGSIGILFVVDHYKHQGKDVVDLFLNQGWWFRVFGIMLILFTILLYGCYGEMYDIQQFIYFQF